MGGGGVMYNSRKDKGKGVYKSRKEKEKWGGEVLFNSRKDKGKGRI